MKKNEPAQIVILAGGLGTRIRPLTDQIPKALIPIRGIPFIHYQLKWLAHCGVRKIILSTGYLGHLIEEFVGNGSRWGVDVTFVNEGKNLRGTGGALRLIYDRGLLQEKFFVTYGDSFLPIDFQDVWNTFLNRSEPALMTVLKNSEKWDTSNSCFQDGRIPLYDKWANPKPPEMKYIDYGLSAFKPEVIERIPSDTKFDLAKLLHELSVKGKLAGYEVQERFYEIGSLQGIQDFEDYVGEAPPPLFSS